MKLSQPAKTSIHFLITLLTTYLLLDSSTRLNRYSMATLHNLCSAFLPVGCQGADGGCRDPTTYDDDRFCRLSRKNATFDSVDRVVSGYYHGVADAYLAGYLNLPLQTGSSPPDAIDPIVMTVESYDNDPDRFIERAYNLTGLSLGPLDYRRLTTRDVSEFYAR